MAPRSTPTKSDKSANSPRRVIVVGAGMSGLACAKELQHRRYEVLVLESRSRVGGRVCGEPIYTVDGETHNVDLGGALIHGTDGNPLSQLCVKLGVGTTGNLDDCLLLDNNGWPVESKQDEKVNSVFNQVLEETFEQISKQPDNGVHSEDGKKDNFGKLFDSIVNEHQFGSLADTPLWNWHQANLELSCGTSFEELGHTWNDDEAYGYEGAHVALRDSWKPVVEALADGLHICYDCPVVGVEVMDGKDSQSILSQPLMPPPAKIDKPQPDSSPSRKSRRLQGEDASLRRSSRTPRQTSTFSVSSHAALSYDDADIESAHMESRKRGRTAEPVQDDTPKVRVVLQNGAVLEADAIVCSLPLRVLQTNKVQFTPPLPQSKQDAIASLGCGLLNKCILSFDHVFWQESDFFGLAGDESPFLILNGTVVTGKPILIFMFGGQSAFDVEHWKDDELVGECMDVLKKIVKQVPPEPIDYVVTRWGQDANAGMSFSFIPPGVDGNKALEAMGEPVLSEQGLPMILFAGEHTTAFHPSTIHGAFLSGVREACRLDLMLEPRLNGDLVFDSTNVYQKTFPLKKRFQGAPSQDVLEGSRGNNRKVAAHDEGIPNRRRRHGVMTLREKKPSATAAATLSPSRQSARTSFSEDVPESASRKSHRKGARKSPVPYTNDDRNGEAEINGGNPNGVHALILPQEERTLRRLVHAYPNWQAVVGKVLPLYKSSKKQSSLKQRYQQLRKAKRSDKSRLVDWTIGSIQSKQPAARQVASPPFRKK